MTAGRGLPLRLFSRHCPNPAPNRRAQARIFTIFRYCTAAAQRLSLQAESDTTNRPPQTGAANKAMPMETTTINPVELKVFLNHVYELKKGVRQMVLHTMNRKYEAFAVRRLTRQGIPFFIQPAGRNSVNLFFGKGECIEAIKHLVNCPLYELSPEKDFILGAMLGYNICDQCRRYCDQKAKAEGRAGGRRDAAS